MDDFYIICSDKKFLSTPSARRATDDARNPMKLRQISIHALCEEGDPERRASARSVRISIHALCEEGDPSTTQPASSTENFYPRPLRGGRPYAGCTSGL